MKTEYSDAALFLEAHFVHGLKALVMQELRQRLGHALKVSSTSDPERIRFGVTNDFDALSRLRSVNAFYLGRHYAIPRPKALLGNQHFQLVLNQIELVCRRQHRRPFRSFRLEAAGADSTTFLRLRQQITMATALADDPDDGDLVIRVFRDPEVAGQWALLCRLTPRPLSMREWRVVDVQGALNGTIAAAAMILSKAEPADRFINLMCGSGTLLIERLLLDCTAVAVGCDSNAAMLAAAKANIAAAALSEQIVLMHEDATQLPFPAASFDLLAADLPWGQLIGDHANNEVLYPRLLREAARIARPAARFILITPNGRLLESSLAEVARLWQLRKTVALAYKNVRPRIYLLQRR